MTKKEAISLLKLAKAEIEWEYPLDYQLALDKAIEALEQEPCDDAISRQEVLNNAYAYGNGLEPDGYCVNVEDIQALPPVTPQPRSEVLDKIYADIQRLRGCSCSCSDGIIDDVEDILDKYKTESEDRE